MKTFVCCFIAVFLSLQSCQAGAIDSIEFGAFGKIILYHPAQKPTSVALFVSGDGGWNSGVINMAKNIANQGGLVLGIDARTYKKAMDRESSECLYPAADFEDLSLTVQKKYRFPSYLKPVLVGYSYGAVLVYGILAQAPANTFKGAIALGFCPDIELPRSLCKGTALSMHKLKANKSYYLDRTEGLTAPFIALNGTLDENCPYATSRDFLRDMPMAQLISLPKVGHGFSVNANWAPEFNNAYRKIISAPSFTQMKNDQNTILKVQKLTPLPGDLPLTFIPAAQNNNSPLVFFISGDGGWTSFDQSLSESVAKRGLPVVGMDSQKYFWNKKTPEQSAADVSQAIVHYMRQWNKKSFILMGFSFGASVVPFVTDRLSDTLKEDLKGIICLSPDENADFEIHITDMLNIGKNNGAYNALLELIKIKSINPLCVFGKEENSEVENKLSREGIKTITIPGGHHYANNYSELTNIIIEHVK